ncbi:hypothetical protein HYW21_02960 [Candidatus Woesearchaeota archaeon]|nr:hypothetical protein [Candidatus Woesearchaeota archaeon]
MVTARNDDELLEKISLLEAQRLALLNHIDRLKQKQVRPSHHPTEQKVILHATLKESYEQLHAIEEKLRYLEEQYRLQKYLPLQYGVLILLLVGLPFLLEPRLTGFVVGEQISESLSSFRFVLTIIFIVLFLGGLLLVGYRAKLRKEAGAITITSPQMRQTSPVTVANAGKITHRVGSELWIDADLQRLREELIKKL